VATTKQQKLDAFSRLLDIMDELREQCPWDQKQTNESLRHLTIEETYELSDAILKNDSTEIKKELGDVLLHIVFYARIGSETGAFDIADVCNSLCEKLISRHPHIYGDVKVENAEQVKENWEQLKLKEGNKSVLSGVAKGTPSIVKALRMQEKAAQVGFDWPTAKDVWAKVDEELAELKEEFAAEVASEKTEKEFGDFLFSLINVARRYDINPDDALEKTNQKFIERFQYIEAKAAEQNRKLTEMTLDEMDVYWNKAKQLR
jgi:XTP/dITP diphosphohydrolase